MIAFLDSSALIYFFEGALAHQRAVEAVLGNLRAENAQAVLAVSRLAVLECRVKPLRNGNSGLLTLYDAFFRQVQIVELTASVVDIATQLHATTTLKTPDALQAASALNFAERCTFIAGDAGFARVTALNLRHVSVE